MMSFIIPQVEDIQKDILQHLKETMEFWDGMGLSLSQRQKRMEDMLSINYSKLAETAKEARDTDYESFSKLQNFIEDKQRQVNDMLHALHLPSFQADLSVGLLLVGKTLKEKFEELKKVKDERLLRLQKLKEQRDEHCTSMGREPKQLNLLTNIPSEEELKQLQVYVDELLSERKKMMVKTLPVKKSLMSLMKEMDLEARNEFEKSVFGPDKEFNSLGVQLQQTWTAS